MEVGQNLPPMTFKAFDREQLKKFASAALDHNPIHLDEAFAKAAGFPTVIVHGMLSMSVLGEYVARTFPQWKIRKFEARFKMVTFPGDAPTCHAKVKSTEGGLVVNVWVENQHDAGTLSGMVELIPA